MESMKKDAEAVKKDAENVKGVATDIKIDTKDIKENTESLKKDMEIIKKMQQNLEEDLTQIKEYVKNKPMENTERNNLSNPEESTEESTFSVLYLFAFRFALTVMNSGCEKFGVTSEHKNNAQPFIFYSVVVTYWHCILKLKVVIAEKGSYQRLVHTNNSYQ